MNPIEIHTSICKKQIDNYFTYSIPDNTKVKINGFVMLKGLDDGKTFTVKRNDAKGIYWFCVPKTGRKVIGHYMDSVDSSLRCFERGDNNCIQCI
jgi:hypothetical protein